MTIHCEYCGEYYETVRARTQHFNLLIIYYAICPCCEEARIPLSLHDKRPRCTTCNIPINPGTKNPKGLCRAHYVAAWRISVKSRNKTDDAKYGECKITPSFNPT